MKLKQVTAMALSGMILLSGCGTSNSKTPANSETASSVVASTSSSTSSAKASIEVFGANLTEIPERSGSGDVIGAYGVLLLNKDSFQGLSYDKIKEGFKTIEAQADRLNYVTLCFEDGTGILLAGCSPILATYGEIDENYNQTSTSAFLEDKDTYFVLTGSDKNPIVDTTDPKGINGLK